MNQIKKLNTFMTMCVLSVTAVLILSGHYFYITFKYYSSGRDVASLIITLVFVILSLLIIPYGTFCLHEYGHKFLYHLAGTESKIRNKSETENLSIILFYKHFFIKNVDYGWITKTDIPGFDEKLLKRDPMMYIMICLAGVLTNTIVCLFLSLVFIFVNMDIACYSGSFAIAMIIYAVLILGEYQKNIYNKENERSDGYKARVAIAGMEDGTIWSALKIKLHAASIYLRTKIFHFMFYIYEHPLYFIVAVLLLYWCLFGSIAEAYKWTSLVTTTILIIVCLLSSRVNECLYINNVKNEFMMYPGIHVSRKNDRKSTIEVLTDYYINGIVKYCDTFSINRYLKCNVHIKTYQVTIDAISKRFPDFKPNIGTPTYEINWNRLFFIKPVSVFNHLGYGYFTRKEACYIFDLSYGELTELRRMIANELPK